MPRRTRARHRCNHCLNVALSVMTMLFLGGFLIQLQWYKSYSSPNVSSAKVFPGFVDPSGSCSNTSSISTCNSEGGSSNQLWSFQPPALLLSTCRRLRDRQATKILLVFVPVHPKMLAQRMVLRETLGAEFEHLTFVVQLRRGQPPESALAKEMAEFGDVFLIYGPTDEAYNCLTLKVLAFLRWYAAGVCSGVFHYLLKSDHDSFWHAASLLRLLRQRQLWLEGRRTPVREAAAGSPTLVLTPRPPNREILGSVQVGSQVVRNPSSKFCTTLAAYNHSVYPVYTSGGPGYLLSSEAVAALVEAANAPTAPHPFWIEDVYITGILAAKVAALKHVHSAQILYLATPAELLPAAVLTKPPLGAHKVGEEKLRLLHRLVKGPAIDGRAGQLHSFQWDVS